MLYGTDNFSDELRHKINQVYNTLHSCESYPEKLHKLSLFDLVLISRVCTTLYGLRGDEHERGTRSPYFRLVDAHKTLSTLMKELEFHNNLIKANITSTNGSTAAAEELLVQQASTLLKMMFVSCENVITTLALTPNRPYNLAALIEASLDKAYVKKNQVVKHKPRSGEQSKKQPEGEA